MDPLQNAVDYLKTKGIEVEPKKSLFQVNQEMGVMLLTLLMSEVDSLRNRVKVLEEGGATGE
ncbi:hypothetical protein H7B90_00660 [Cohnella xylanilytica]|uniref:Uncharacterized protein n=1 Tax=Cohnella xylanilytica TaxID=557555 RepID=A0A841TST7_9BACL|nr:hypothetical protein [Cohnella xylanilytica]MBB6689902.1 hypothetical protein [Cohnella xylanilytica]